MFKRITGVYPIVAALLLTACGGGGGGGGISGTPAVVATPARQTGQVQLNLKIPSVGTTAHWRAPKYVSPFTASIAITANGAPVQASSNCPDGSNCVVTFSLLPGTYTIDITLFDGPGHPLSHGVTTAAVSVDQTTVLHLVFNGIPARAVLRFDPATPPLVGVASNVHVLADATDAAGWGIVGDNYASPITISISDPLGHTRVTSAAINSPSDYATIAYDGKLIAQADLPQLGASSGSTNLLPTSGPPTLFVPDPISTYPVSYTPLSFAAGADGNMWFTECNGLAGPCKVGRITPSGVLSETANIAGAFAITQGPDGNMWFSEGANRGYVGKVAPDMTVTEILVHALAPSEGYTIDGIVTGADGHVWMHTTLSAVEIVPPATVITHAYTGPRDVRGNLSDALVKAPDGSMWYNAGVQAFGKIDTAGNTTGYPLTLPMYIVSNMVVAADGNIYTLSDIPRGPLLQITPSATPAFYGNPAFATTAPLTFAFGKFWSGTGNALLSMTPANVVTRYVVPNGNLGTGISSGTGAAWGADGNYWSAYRASGAFTSSIVRFRYNP